MKDEPFFKDLGSRIANFRKARGLTQTALADALGVRHQQVVASYENAVRRVPASLLVPLTTALGVSLDELLGVEPSKLRPGPAPKLQSQFEAVGELSAAEQKLVSQLLERFIKEESAA